MRFLLVASFFFALLPPKPADSQPPDKRVDTTYTVVDVPQSIVAEIPDVKESLNAALKKATTDKEAFTIINGKLRIYKNLPLRLRKQTGEGHFKYVVYYVAAPAVAQTRLVDIKATKGIIDETVYRRHQFASALTDTVAALDTLRLRVFPADFNWKITDYVLRFSAGGETYESELSSEGTNTLLFCPEDLPEKGRAYSCILRHKGTGTTVAAFWLRFLDDAAQTELRSVAESLNENSTTSVGRVRHLQVYASGYWGQMQAENIRRWLQKKGIK